MLQVTNQYFGSSVLVYEERFKFTFTHVEPLNSHPQQQQQNSHITSNMPLFFFLKQNNFYFLTRIMPLIQGLQRSVEKLGAPASFQSERAEVWEGVGQQRSI